jgi:hypothetical protein
VLVCSSSGALAVLGGGGSAAGPGPPRLLACAALPGEVFSSPAATMQGGAALCVLGCRDDHLYCFSI